MEEKVQISVRGRYDPHYALVVDHEGYTPVVAAQVKVEGGDNRTVYTINKKVDKYAIDFAIRRLKQPFFVIPNENDLVSNSGEHSVQFSNSFLLSRDVLRGLCALEKEIPRLYILEKELTFPRPRPRIGDLMEKLKNLHYVAWVVSGDRVRRLWILKYAGRSSNYIELTIPEDFEFKRLQGNLYYAPAELDEETELPWRARFRIFNHKFEHDVCAVSFVYDDGVYAVVQTSNTCIHSEDHETVTLNPGTYLLYHPFPRSPRRDID